jgi:hypothetical protein
LKERNTEIGAVHKCAVSAEHRAAIVFFLQKGQKPAFAGSDPSCKSYYFHIYFASYHLLP